MSDYAMSQRGIIQNRERKQQIADMSGLRWGKITPTDIDAFIDFGDKIFIFIESKLINTRVSRGQEWALERLCDSTDSPPRRYSFAFIADHNTPISGDVDFANMTVRSVRKNKQWVRPSQLDLTVRQAIDRVIFHVERSRQTMLVSK